MRRQDGGKEESRNSEGKSLVVPVIRADIIEELPCAQYGHRSCPGNRHSPSHNGVCVDHYGHRAGRE